jgi:hypothetical protein
MRVEKAHLVASVDKGVATRAVREWREARVERDKLGLPVIRDTQNAAKVGSTEGYDDRIQLFRVADAPVGHRAGVATFGRSQRWSFLHLYDHAGAP